MKSIQITNTRFEGLYILTPRIFPDERGGFIKIFHQESFAHLGLESTFQECFFSYSHKGVLRGMHFQIPPHDCTKLVYVSSGKIEDVVLDIRKYSASFGEAFHITLDSACAQCLYIPSGFAHGFLSLEEGSIVHYLQTKLYAPQSDSGILYDSFGFDWQKVASQAGIQELIISKRDREFERFSKDFSLM